MQTTVASPCPHAAAVVGVASHRGTKREAGDSAAHCRRGPRVELEGSAASTDIVLTAPRCPKSVVANLKAVGAEVSYAFGLHHITFTHGDAASVVWEAYLCAVPETSDPFVTAIRRPPSGIRASNRDTAAILDEASSIVETASRLHTRDVQSVLSVQELIGVPSEAPAVGGCRFQCSAMSGARVYSMIANPGPAFPRIHGLAPGAYICTIRSSWIGTMQDCHVFRAS